MNIPNGVATLKGRGKFHIVEAIVDGEAMNGDEVTYVYRFCDGGGAAFALGKAVTHPKTDEMTLCKECLFMIRAQESLGA